MDSESVIENVNLIVHEFRGALLLLCVEQQLRTSPHTEVLQIPTQTGHQMRKRPRKAPRLLPSAFCVAFDLDPSMSSADPAAEAERCPAQTPIAAAASLPRRRSSPTPLSRDRRVYYARAWYPGEDEPRRTSLRAVGAAGEGSGSAKPAAPSNSKKRRHGGARPSGRSRPPDSGPRNSSK